MTLPQDTIIEIFLHNPTENSFIAIHNKDLALRLLEEQKDSAKKLYFLSTKERISRYDALIQALKENNSNLIKRLSSLEDFNSEEINNLLYTGNDYIKEKIDCLLRCVKELALSAIKNDDLIELEGILDKYGKMWNFEYNSTLFPINEDDYLELIRTAIQEDSVEVLRLLLDKYYDLEVESKLQAYALYGDKYRYYEESLDEFEYLLISLITTTENKNIINCLVEIRDDVRSEK